jgi:acyl carrier protein
MGVRSIAPAQGLAALGAALRIDRPQIAVLNMDWRVLAQQAGEAVPSFVRDVLREAVPAAGARRVDAPGADATAGALARLLDDAPPADRELVLREHLQAEIGKVLGLSSSSSLHPNRGLMELGMDSLMAVELSNRLTARLGRTMPPTLAFEHPTLAELARHLLDRLGLASSDRAPGATDAAAGVSDADLEQALLSELDKAGY